MRDNPYTLVFGKEPAQLLSRFPGDYEIIEDFESENSNHVYMITGLRGSGKTVLMTGISKRLASEPDWVVIDLTPDIDLIQSFNAELGEYVKRNKWFQVENVAISLPGFQVEIKGQEPITDARMAAMKLLEIVKKRQKKVLVTIDESVSNERVKTFAGLFQVFLRKELPIYLLMTGLYENIRLLQNQDTLTFLYRAPRLEMKPLGLGSIQKNYKETFSLTDEDAREMAKETKGYPFAFQVLGYMTWNQKGDFRSVLPDYSQYLADYVYDKIWMTLSEKDREICKAIAQSKLHKTGEIKEILEMKQNEFSPYRKRLLDKGIVVASGHGLLEFTLPHFDDYVMEQ